MVPGLGACTSGPGPFLIGWTGPAQPVPNDWSTVGAQAPAAQCRDLGHDNKTPGRKEVFLKGSGLDVDSVFI